MAQPQLLFGGASIGSGRFASAKEVSALFQMLRSRHIHRIDIAPIYPASAPGQAEQLLGDCKPAELGFTVDTKILLTNLTGEGTLKASAISHSIKQSQARLRTQINVLYCHLPDPQTPIAETASAFHKHYQQQDFLKLGVSNFTTDQLSSYLATCDQHNYIKPTYFQGQYNALCRSPEKDLLPLLRKHHIAYVAYSPLAGGFLTGIFTEGGAKVTGTRFEDGNKVGAFYKRMYDKPVMHAVVNKLQGVCDKHGIVLFEAALRWLFFHSALGEEDGVILGVSREEQLKANTESLEKGPLPEEVREVFESIWIEVETEAPKQC